MLYDRVVFRLFNDLQLGDCKETDMCTAFVTAIEHVAEAFRSINEVCFELHQSLANQGTKA